MSVSFSDSPDDNRRGADVQVLPAAYLSRLAAAGDRPAPAEPATIFYGGIEHMGRALLYGCADYLAEPWLPEELFFRCGRLGKSSTLEYPGGLIEVTPFALISADMTVAISRQEYILLRTLMRNMNSPVSRGVLYRILGRDADTSSARLVDVHMSSLRKKLKICGLGSGRRSGWEPIRSVRGYGYGLSNMMWTSCGQFISIED